MGRNAEAQRTQRVAEIFFARRFSAFSASLRLVLLSVSIRVHPWLKSHGTFRQIQSRPRETHSKLIHEIKRIVRVAETTADSIEEIEAAIIAADMGMAMTRRYVRRQEKFRIAGRRGSGFSGDCARRKLKKVFQQIKTDWSKTSSGPTIVSIVGVNGTGKTTTSAKLAHFIQSQKKTALLAACDTFRAAAIEQFKLWGTRLKVEVIAGATARIRRPSRTTR